MAHGNVPYPNVLFNVSGIVVDVSERGPGPVSDTFVGAFQQREVVGEGEGPVICGLVATVRPAQWLCF